MGGQSGDDPGEPLGQGREVEVGEAAERIWMGGQEELDDAPVLGPEGRAGVLESDAGAYADLQAIRSLRGHPARALA